MTKYIINADDFGLSPGINRAIQYCFFHHYITEASLMCNMEYFEDALTLYDPAMMNVGIHLTITAGKPLLATKYIVRDGAFIKSSEYKTLEFTKEVIEEIQKEWEAQILKAIQSGIKITHLDTHHHMHMNYPILHEIFFSLARKYHLPIRYDHQKCLKLVEDLIAPDDLVWDFDEQAYQGKIDANYLSSFKDVPVIEIMCHPGFLDYYLYNHSSMNMERIYTIEGLKQLKEFNLNMISFQDL